VERVELKAIDRTDRGLSRLNAALRIYRDTILPEAQNPERQILYWIDHSKDTLADEFRCFAIQHGTFVVGYLQYSYFREENIFFLEYLCIKDARNRGLRHSEAIEGIQDFFINNYPRDFTVVFEVARTRQTGDEWNADSKLIRYFKRLGRVDGFDKGFDKYYPAREADERAEGDVSFLAT